MWPHQARPRNLMGLGRRLAGRGSAMEGGWEACLGASCEQVAGLVRAQRLRSWRKRAGPVASLEEEGHPPACPPSLGHRNGWR